MTGLPQLIVTLAPSGDLQVELPGYMATRRKIILRDEDAVETLKRILQHQLEGETEIGEDGAPTRAQVWHWERHQIWPGAGCRFCIAEGRVRHDGRIKSNLIMKRSDGVEVRRIAPGKSGIKREKSKVVVATVNKSAEEMGL